MICWCIVLYSRWTTGINKDYWFDRFYFVTNQTIECSVFIINRSRMYYLLAFIFCLLMTCTKETVQKQTPACLPLLNDIGVYTLESKEVFTIKKLAYDDGCLAVTACYGGGCTEFEPDLVWNKEEGLSIPPQFYLKLYTDVEDNCKALVTKTWTYSLDIIRPLAEKIIWVEDQSLHIKE